MHTNDGVPAAGRRRRIHPPEFKARLIAACQQPGVSISRVALDAGVNANLLRRWIDGNAGPPAAPKSVQVPAAFVPIQIGQTNAEPAPQIIVEIRRGATTVTVKWPTATAGECAGWLRGLLR